MTGKDKKVKLGVGLRGATTADIEALIVKYKADGYKVKHITKNLPHNGILRISYDT